VEDKKHIPKGVWIFHVVWTTILVVGVVAYLLRSSTDRYGFLQTVVLTLTLIGLLFYTLYTRRMQETMVKQTNVGILPVFKLEIIKEGEHHPWLDTPSFAARQTALMVKNVGNGTALNVQIESIAVTCWGHLAMQDFLPVKFERIYSLAPKEHIRVKDTQPFDIATARAVGASRPDLLGWLIGKDAWEDSELRIWFTDILGNKYVQVVHLGKEGIWPDVVQPDKGQVRRLRIRHNDVIW
jgi:hypothetical protein